MAAELQVEFGAPVAAPVEGDGQVTARIVPAGDYLVLRHTGPYDQLIGANAALQELRQASTASGSRSATPRPGRPGQAGSSTT